MKKLDHQLQRLLRAAATASARAINDMGAAPDARALLRERERQLARAAIVSGQVFRVGLAAACVLLMVTLLVGVRQIKLANEDVFAVSEMVLTRVSTP